MSRKDYQALADMIAKVADPAQRVVYNINIGSVLARNNPNFRWDKWLKATEADPVLWCRVWRSLRTGEPLPECINPRDLIDPHYD